MTLTAMTIPNIVRTIDTDIGRNSATVGRG